MLDRLSTRLASLLAGMYDCVDRIVLNAYFQFGQTPAGFRLWWRSLRGSDAELDNAHLRRFGLLTVKLYTEGERVLRSEAIVHNTRALHCGRALPKFPDSVSELAAILQRFLETLDCVDSAFIADDAFEHLPQPGWGGQTRVAGVNLDHPRMRAVIEAVLALAAAPKGFLVAAVAAKVREIRGLDPAAYRARHAAYDLKKLRGKHWVRPIAKSRRYEVVSEGVQAMTAILVLRNKVIKPLLPATAKPTQSEPPERLTPLDAMYRTLQGDMCQLFQLLGIAVQTT